MASWILIGVGRIRAWDCLGSFSPLDSSPVFYKYQAGDGEVGMCFSSTKASEELAETFPSPDLIHWFIWI